MLARHPDLNVLTRWRHHAGGGLAPAASSSTREDVVTTNLLGPIRSSPVHRAPADAPGRHHRHRSSGLAFTPLGATPSYNGPRPRSTCSASRSAPAGRDQRAGHRARPPSVRTGLLPARRQRGRDAARRVHHRGVSLLESAAGREGDPGRTGEVPPYGEARGDYDQVAPRSTPPTARPVIVTVIAVGPRSGPRSNG